MYNTKKLSNGLTIVTESIPFVRSIAFGVWVKNGSRNESLDTNGISHFIEHMFFKGTKRRTAAQIAKEMDEIGGQMNAYTSKEYTCYYTLTLDTHFQRALDILTDMFFNSKFDETDIKKELNVILEEINMYEDTPEELVHDILQESVWAENSLGFPILGMDASISKFTQDTFKTFYHNNYRPENTVIAIAGNFLPDEMMEKVESHFGDFFRDKPFSFENFDIAYKPSVVAKCKEIEQIHLSLSFPGIAIGAENSYEFAILNTIFGSGMSSRLFQKIREEHGLVYSIYSYNQSFTDTGLFSIYAGLNPSQLENVVTLIFEEIKNIFKDKIVEEQIENTKIQFKSNYFLSLESSSSRMNSLGRSQLLLNKVLYPEDVMSKIEAVTLDKVYQVAEQIFDFKNLSAAAVGNLTEKKFAEMIKNAV